MNVVLREAWPVERFLSWEDAQDGRHEFDGSRIIAMTGGSRAHQRIILNIMRLLADRLDPQRFDAVQEMRIEAAGKVRYPDVAVCPGPIAGGVRTLRDATVIFEVLSDDTAGIDRGTKPAEYARLPGMRRYILLEQHAMAATVLELQGEDWQQMQVTTGSLVFLELGIDLPQEAIYRGVGSGQMPAA